MGDICMSSLAVIAICATAKDSSSLRQCRKQAGRIKDEGKFRRDVDKGHQQRIQHPECRQAVAAVVGCGKSPCIFATVATALAKIRPAVGVGRKGWPSEGQVQGSDLFRGNGVFRLRYTEILSGVRFSRGCTAVFGQKSLFPLNSLAGQGGELSLLSMPISGCDYRGGSPGTCPVTCSGVA
jgi:hypothetical protein